MSSIKKLLISNRGEIALRIIRACRELEIKTVAVYSEADKESLHVKFADEAICIGPAQSKESYLNMSRILSAAEVTNADAIHPGYGFLSENAKFSEIVTSHNMVFVGPSPEMITAMGDKALAKETMKKAGVPIVPGSEGIISKIDDAKKIASEIGYPIIIKATAGGGGRGMRVVTKESDLENAFNSARGEAESSFNNPEVYIEKFIVEPRHIEIQVMGDRFENIIHLGERDCSVQRRHQKLIEESPSPAVDDELREKMGQAAIKGAKSVNYLGAGTVEFLLDKNKNFYFMEMNTRIQVEHPVTEFVTGIDLIKMQIQIAEGEKLSKKKIKTFGHAIEVRINAEDPKNNFRPSPGKITSVHFGGGPGVRVDSHIYSGYSVPPYYDSLIAKIIVHDLDREAAINKMCHTLEECVIEGIATTIPFHRSVMQNDIFKSGKFDTNFIDSLKI